MVHMYAETSKLSIIISRKYTTLHHVVTDDGLPPEKTTG